MKGCMLLKLDVKYARDPVILRIFPIKRMKNHVKKRTTLNSIYHILKANSKQLLLDFTISILEILRTKNEGNHWKMCYLKNSCWSIKEESEELQLLHVDSYGSSILEDNLPQKEKDPG
ncbi:hypothetical protein Tco_1341479, partial [Tanacetum coccineum]